MKQSPGESRGRVSPYKGLEPFDENDASYFFGREREARLIIASLFASRLTLLYGESGVGKSSVLRAGVLRRLRPQADVLPVVFPTFVEGDKEASIRGWQSDPVGGIKEATAAALLKSAGADDALKARYVDVIRANEYHGLRRFLEAVHEACDRRLMVILDQFEEYSLYHPSDDALDRELPAAIVPSDLSVSFLISLREDGLGRLDRFRTSIPSLWDSYRRIDYLTNAAAADAIKLPLDEYNKRENPTTPVTIEASLVDAVLREVQAGDETFSETGTGVVVHDAKGVGRIETPYLQMVMMRIWEREQADGSSQLRQSTLREEGGSAEIVKGHLDRVMAQFSPAERDIATKVFARLVTPSGSKIAFSANDLASLEGIDPLLLGPILRRLEEGQQRILRRVATRGSAEDRYEIFHDRLGNAILSWRAKRDREAALERSQTDAAEVRRVELEAQAKVQKTVDAVLGSLTTDDRNTWTRFMFFLVTSTGTRAAQTPQSLAEHSQQPVLVVKRILDHLVSAGLVRQAYGTSPDSPPLCEVATDPIAKAMLDWHSRFVQRSSAEGRGLATVSLTTQTVAPASKSFAYSSVAMMLARGQIMPFLGSGVPMSARGHGGSVPSARELKKLIATHCDFPASEFEAADISEVASYFARKFGRPPLDRLLVDAFAHGPAEPSDTHRLIAAAATRAPIIILTTNYDALMEKALEEAGVPFNVVAYMRESDQGAQWYDSSSNEDVPPNIMSAPDTPVVVRLHGWQGPGTTPGSFVITEEDQIEWLLGVGQRSVGLPMFVLVALERCRLLSLGHSARDWTQRALLHILNRRKRHTQKSGWAVSLDPSPMSVLTWRRYEMEVHNLELNDWALGMMQALYAV